MLGAVEHHGLGQTLVVSLNHFLHVPDSIAPDIVDADIEDVVPFAFLFAGHFDQPVPVVVLSRSCLNFPRPLVLVRSPTSSGAGSWSSVTALCRLVTEGSEMGLRFSGLTPLSAATTLPRCSARFRTNSRPRCSRHIHERIC